MELNEAKKILNENGYEMELNEDWASFCAASPGIAGIIVFFAVVFPALSGFGILYGIGKLISSIFKKITMRTQQDKVIIDTFKKQLEKLYDDDNKIKLAEYIFDKLKIDKLGVEHFLSIEDVERAILVSKFLKNYLPKGIKLDSYSIHLIPKLLYELALLLTNEKLYKIEVETINDFIDVIIYNIDNYEYKNK